MHRILTRNTKTLSIVLGLTAVSPSAFAGGFTGGNIVVDRIGDGSATLTSAATATFLDEYTPAGALVQSVALPTTAVGGTAPSSGNFSFSSSGTATSEGFINISSNGQYITVTGYNAPLGTLNVPATAVNTTTNANLRVVGLVNVSTGAIDTSTGLVAPPVPPATTSTGYYTGSNVRDSVTVDGTSLYTSGVASASTISGVAYTAADTVGNSVGVTSGTSISNVRAVGINNNTLYYSTGSGGRGIYRVPGPNADGSGLPTTATAPVQIATADPAGGTAASSPYDFVFTDPNTLYVADDRGTGGGVEKFTSTDGFATLTNTTLAYTLTITGATVGLRSIAYDGTNLYVTTTSTTANKVISFTDPGAAGAVTGTTIATAAANEVFRGVRVLPTPVVAPEPGSLVVTLLGMGMLGGLIAFRRRASMNV